MIEQSERVLIRTDRNVLIDEIEHAVRVGAQMRPQLLIGPAQQRLLGSDQAAGRIDRLPVSRAFTRVAIPAETAKHGHFERTSER